MSSILYFLIGLCILFGLWIFLNDDYHTKWENFMAEITGDDGLPVGTRYVRKNVSDKGTGNAGKAINNALTRYLTNDQMMDIIVPLITTPTIPIYRTTWRNTASGANVSGYFGGNSPTTTETAQIKAIVAKIVKQIDARLRSWLTNRNGNVQRPHDDTMLLGGRGGVQRPHSITDYLCNDIDECAVYSHKWELSEVGIMLDGTSLYKGIVSLMFKEKMTYELYLTISDANIYGIELAGNRQQDEVELLQTADKTSLDVATSHNFGCKTETGVLPLSKEERLKIIEDHEKAPRAFYSCVGRPSARNKMECEAVVGYTGKSDATGAGIWDKPCELDEECPFYRGNRNYPNKRGKCGGDGKCEMPIGVRLAGFRRYYGDAIKEAVCSGCVVKSDTKCCKEQLERKGKDGGYDKLMSPDFRYVGDIGERTTYKRDLMTHGLKP